MQDHDMSINKEFFQPYHGNYTFSIIDLDSTKFRQQIISFLNATARQSFQEAKDIQTSLVAFFNKLGKDWRPLSDRERFLILRAIAIVPVNQRELVLNQATELSMGRPSCDIVESICVMHTHASIIFDSPHRNNMTENENLLKDLSVRALICQALKTIIEREQREMLARYFLLCHSEAAKAHLAQSVINSMTATGKYIMPTQSGVIEFIGNRVLNVGNANIPHRS